MEYNLCTLYKLCYLFVKYAYLLNLSVILKGRVREIIYYYKVMT